MFDHLPRLVLVPHADAGDRRTWTTDQDLRPLSGRGVEQAAELAEAIGVVDRIISSPARRCVETVQPVAARSDVPIERSDDLREIAFVDEVDGWDRWPMDAGWRGQLVAAAALGRAVRVLQPLAGTTPEATVVLSAHGDLVPLLALFVAGSFRVPAPSPLARGGAYVVDPSNRGEPIAAIGAVAPLPSEGTT